MPYQHGVRVQEQATSVVAPITGTAGLQVVFGTAPVNLADNPYKATNTPIIAYNWAEAVSKLGYSEEKDANGRYLYTLCEAMYASFKLFGVAPVIFINVLDPAKHKKALAALPVAVEDMEATVAQAGLLLDTVKITAPGKVDKYTAVIPETGDNPAAEGWFVLSDGTYTATEDTEVQSGVTYYRQDFVDDLDVEGNPAEQGYYEYDEEARSYKPTEDTEVEDGKSYYSVEYIAVRPTPDSNPAAEGWFVLSDGAYIATTDTTARSGVTYYERTEEDADVDLVEGKDYALTFDDDGYLTVTLIPGGAGANASTIKVSGTQIDPSAVTSSDVIGVSAGGTEKGMEVLRQVYPKFGMTPGLLLAPGWSQISDVGIALAAKCEEINGYFTCEAFVDIDSSDNGCTDYSDIKTAKENAGCTSKHVMALWPCIAVGSRKFWYSAVMGALTAYTDASNDDVPNLSPSNKLLGVTGTVLADALYTEDISGNGTWDKEVLLDQLQANAVNSFGVSTAFNNNGWRSWGNNSAAYPATTDIKDRFFCCRRFFSWWGNSFILTYAQKVDDPANRRLIEAIVDSENIRGNAYVAQGKCAAAYIEFTEAENPVTDLLNGKLTFHQHLSPYPPAEDILNTLEFDPDALTEALTA